MIKPRSHAAIAFAALEPQFRDRHPWLERLGQIVATFIAGCIFFGTILGIALATSVR